MSTVEVPLSRGHVAIIDAADAATVLAHKWYARAYGRNFYAVREVRGANGKRTTLRLHKFLTGYSTTDHVNGDGLDNRRSNLRPATTAENIQNSRRRVDNTTGFKGVCWHKAHLKWRAYIAADGQSPRHLGYYGTAEEAARAYDAAARDLHGEYATLNFPAAGERAA